MSRCQVSCFYFTTLLNISELFSWFFIFTILSYVIFQCNNDSDNCKGPFELRNTKKKWKCGGRFTTASIRCAKLNDLYCPFGINNSNLLTSQYYNFQTQKVQMAHVYLRSCLSCPLIIVLTSQLIYNTLLSDLKWQQSEKSEFEINFSMELSFIEKLWNMVLDTVTCSLQISNNTEPLALTFRTVNNRYFIH